MGRNENKTTFTGAPVREFIDSIEIEQRRADANRLLEIHEEETGHQPRMWGPSIIGFDSYHYRYASGREGDAPAAGFSPRKPQSVVYLYGGYEELYPDELAKLGPYKSGKSCLYIKRLADIDEDILRFLIRDSYRRVKEEYPDDSSRI